MRNPPRNPYLDHDLIELAAQCMQRSRELKERVQRTPEQRAALADDTAFLLTAAGSALDSSEYMPGNPEYASRSEGRISTTEFMRWHLRHIHNSRYRTYLRALDLAAGKSREAWRVDVLIDGNKPDALAVESDEGLRAVLDELAKLPRWGYRRRG
ncbi:hypothetical protein [Lysobacter gummosus]|uniref:Uncharacterized protein n=1 Tax=Lysobacter gummosus TaxID=262324 RepID=A0ABY3X695_9GAMM|nr:hypothetical protein [Lysobacter gummosus]UNP28093.1 hypothetical protein MOV92_16515 [Lysobacter gummosus]